MQIDLDNTYGTGCMYVQVTDQPVYKTREVQPFIWIDFDKDDKVVGIEFVDLSGEIELRKLK